MGGLAFCGLEVTQGCFYCLGAGCWPPHWLWWAQPPQPGQPPPDASDEAQSQLPFLKMRYRARPSSARTISSIINVGAFTPLHLDSVFERRVKGNTKTGEDNQLWAAAAWAFLLDLGAGRNSMKRNISSTMMAATVPTPKPPPMNRLPNWNTISEMQ